MTWADFYLTCFVLGFLLSALSFLLGSFHFHIPGLGDSGHAGHVDAGHADFGHGEGEHVGGRVVPGQAAHLSFLNFGTITAFMTWFGGTGFILSRYSGFWLGLIALISAGVGLVGAAIVFWFVGKVLMADEKELDPADYDMVGVLGRISSSIRAGGTGEIIYSQAGTRHTCGARHEDGTAIEKGSEVVVTRYERGIAYVRRWEDLTNGTPTAESTQEQK